MARVRGYDASSDWRPWGLYDSQEMPRVAELAISEAMILLEIDETRRTDLVEHVRTVAEVYWQTKRRVTRPPAQWYRDQIKPIQKATDDLLKIIKKPATDMARSTFQDLMLHRMGRRLRGASTEEETVEQILQQLKRVCDEYLLRKKGAPGAKKEVHVQEGVLALSKIWRKFTGKRLPKSFDTDIGPDQVQEFTSPGPQFCHVVLKAIDPDLSISQIETAIRNQGSRGPATIARARGLQP